MSADGSAETLEWVVPFRLGLRVAYRGFGTAALRVFLVSVIATMLLLIAGWIALPLMREYVVPATILFFAIWLTAVVGFAAMLILSAIVDRIWPCSIRVSADEITLPRAYRVRVVDLKKVGFVRLPDGAHEMVLDWGVGERRYGVPTNVDVAVLDALLRGRAE